MDVAKSLQPQASMHKPVTVTEMTPVREQRQGMQSLTQQICHYLTQSGKTITNSSNSHELAAAFTQVLL